MERISFNTLVKSNKVKYDNRWKPLTIENIEEEIKSWSLRDIDKGIRKNIAYNLQYLEYLTYQMYELDLNGAITTSIIKNYVIIGSSIIEAVFYLLIKNNDLCTKSNLEKLFTTSSNEKKCYNESVIVETIVYKKVEPFEITMSYDAMIKKIKSKKLLSISDNVFPYIEKYRKLRNRVHLQLCENYLDTDWWSFSFGDYLVMRYMLYKILNDKSIKSNEEQKSCLYFLELNADEKRKLSEYFKSEKK